LRLFFRALAIILCVCVCGLAQLSCTRARDVRSCPCWCPCCSDGLTHNSYTPQTMTSQPEFIKAFKEADPEASREDIDKAWKEEKQREDKRLAAEAEREEKRLAAEAEREEKRLAAEAEREHELAKLRIAQQRDGDGKLFVSCFAFGFP
jgi:hypothetical protein